MSITTITATEFATICHSGKKIDVIDVRTPAEYREVHLEVARNIPLDSLDLAGVVDSRDVAVNGPIYVVCRSGSRGRQGCEKLVSQGSTDVVNIEGGTLACIAAGVPVVRGKAMMSLERQVRIAAGSIVVIGVLLSVILHPIFIWLSAFVGAGLVFAGLTDTCGMGLLLAKMPWNQSEELSKSCCISSK